MSDKPASLWNLVLIPAAISLVVTIVRLIGEIQGWNETLFGNAAPGGKAAQGLFGISWLILVFGFWFGWRLRRLHDEPAHAGKAALRVAIGSVVLIGGMFALGAADLISFPNEESPAEAKGFAYMLGLLAIAGIVTFTAWPRLATTLILYGLLARIPVVVITYIALDHEDWNTHYTKLPAGTLLPEGVSKFQFLAMPQVTFWIVATMLFGGLMGCLGAALARRRAA